jgi:hypothetical protein
VIVRERKLRLRSDLGKQPSGLGILRSRFYRLIELENRVFELAASSSDRAAAMCSAGERAGLHAATTAQTTAKTRRLAVRGALSVREL